MQKLVLSYTVTDGCTYSSDVIQPIEYESAEALIVHIDDGLRAYLTGHADVNVLSDIIPAHDIHNLFLYLKPEDKKYFKTSDMIKTVRFGKDAHCVIDLPTIQTLEEWFEKNKKGE